MRSYADGRRRVLVVGLGSYAFGRESRAVRTFRHMEGVAPYFLIPKWGDGSVDSLLQRSGFSFDRVPFGYLGRSRALWSAITVAHMPLLQWRIVRGYRDKGCETVIVLNSQAIINAPLALWMLKYLYKADIVLYLGDIPAETWLHRRVANLANQLARRVIVISEAVKRGLLAVGFAPERIDVVHNGLDLEEFMNVVPIDFRARFGWAEESPLMARVYAALDVLVVPSIHEEPLGNVVLEAMASGTPVIGTLSGGIPEMIREGETGFLVAKKDPEELAAQILRLLKDPELRAKMGTAARERVAEAFDIKNNVRKLEQLLFSEG